MTSTFFTQYADKLDMDIISEHEEAISYLKNNMDKINWSALSRNSGAFQLLYNNKDKINWNELGHNTAPNTDILYEGYMDKITNWMPICKNKSNWINKILDGNIDKLNAEEIIELSANPAAITTIIKYKDKMNKYGLVKNEQCILHRLTNNVPHNYCAYSFFIPYLYKNRDKIDRYIYLNMDARAEELVLWYFNNDDINSLDTYWWKCLSSNPAAVKCFKNNQEAIRHICWIEFCKLEEAIDIIKQNKDKIDWNSLSFNQKATDLLESNINKINWKNISHNKGILYVKRNNNSIQTLPEYSAFEGLNFTKITINNNDDYYEILDAESEYDY